ncbi:hypothetical protein ABT282_08825 [Streptomyces sp. NPDC000927]|uniref:hypothetical protein n=1 Tax=Streptomyces sp. NPDC000927 TaxID=3154371 RepID=UPI003328CB60
MSTPETRTVGRTQQRLLAKLREAGVTVPDGTRLAPTRASRSQRNLGAWSWAALLEDGRELRLGSRENMTELVRAERLYLHTDWGGDVNVASDPGGN